MDQTLTEVEVWKKAARKAYVFAFYERLLKAFPYMECHKVLEGANWDPRQAAYILSMGGWRKAKLISWDHVSLQEKVEELNIHPLTLKGKYGGLNRNTILELLQNLGGSKDLFIRMMGCGTIYPPFSPVPFEEDPRFPPLTFLHPTPDLSIWTPPNLSPPGKTCPETGQPLPSSPPQLLSPQLPLPF